MSFRRTAAWTVSSALGLGFAALSIAQDSQLYASLAARARETAAMARRTAAGERENARQARENAKTWRDLAEQARRAGQEEEARTAESRAERADQSAAEADGAAKMADLRAINAEQEAARFDGMSGEASDREARDEHVAVLTDPDTVFHRVYVLGDPDNNEERDTWAAEQKKLKQRLEANGRQANGSTSTTLVTPRLDALEKKLTELQSVAKPGDELTFYYSGHGGGGPFWGGADLEKEEGEVYEEHININGGQAVTDDQLAGMLSGFDAGVSVTLLMDSCFGGGFTGGSTDVQESNSVDVIGVGNTCPGSGDTLSGAAIKGLDGTADYDGDGVITAKELENYLRADGWDVRPPHDTSADLSMGERFDILKEDILNGISGARVRKPSGAAPSETATDADAEEPYDIQSDPESFNAVSGDRDGSIQLMFIDSIVDELGDIVILAEAAPLDRDTPYGVDMLGNVAMAVSYKGGASWESSRAVSLLNRILEERGSSRPPRVRMSFPGGSSAASTAQSPNVSAFITSLGRSYGPSMQMQLVNLGDMPQRLTGEGLVLEPLKKGAQKELQKALSKLAGRNAVTKNLNAYCLEFLRAPPALGTVFRIAEPKLQQQFAPMRHVMEASSRLQELGRLTPDTDPSEYFHSIRQWAIWSRQEGFTDERSFGKAFLDRTKKNFEGSGQRFTKEIESVVQGLVPNRWKDVSSVLAEADALSTAAR